MIAKDIHTRIKEIEIQTRRLLSSMLVGDATSALKGTGVEFDQIREYTQGDDVRFIHWPSSARANSLLVKQFMEERSRTVILVVDSSSTMFFSSTDQLKYDVAAQVAAVLALVADYGKDYVGLLLFASEMVCSVRPQRGVHHVKAIMHHLFSQQNIQKKGSLNNALDEVARIKKKDALVFLVSDFLNDIDEKKLQALSRKHDVVAIRCLDRLEKQVPVTGIMHTTDSNEQYGGQVCLSARKARKITEFLTKRVAEQDRFFRKAHVDLLDVSTDKPFIGEIVTFFRRRMMY